MFKHCSRFQCGEKKKPESGVDVPFLYIYIYISIYTFSLEKYLIYETKMMVKQKMF